MWRKKDDDMRFSIEVLSNIMHLEDDYLWPQKVASIGLEGYQMIDNK